MKPRKFYEKILKSIDSCQTELHLITCAQMIGMFTMRFVGEEDQPDVERFEITMKDQLDNKKKSIGFH
jgi:hypothetical protein